MPTPRRRPSEGASVATRGGTPKRPDNVRPLGWVMLRKYGLLGSLRLLRSDVLFDLLNRVDTARPLSNRTLYGAAGARERNRYVPSTFAAIDAALARVAEELDLADCAFVDCGSGKGKALIAAARHPFRRVRGIELSARLHAIAERNLERLGLAPPRVRAEHGDAAALALAPDERVLYLFNPFTGATLERCLDAVVVAGRERRRYLVYVNPTEHAAFTRRFEPIDHRHFDPGGVEIAFYRTRTPDA